MTLAARVAVSSGDAAVLFLVTQYLRDLGLHTTVVALLRESGVDPFWLCGPSREIGLLREWILQGEWQRVHGLLLPLRDAVGDYSYHVASATVDKQALLEEFFVSTVEFARRRAILEKLRTYETQYGVKLTQQELQSCAQVLRGGAQGVAAPWTLDEARLACFTSLVSLFRGELGSDDDEHKYECMPKRQLVALLNDALAFHRRRTHDAVDIVSVQPESEPILSGGEGESPLQLVPQHSLPEPDTFRVATSLAQSVDFTATPSLRRQPSPSSRSNATSQVKTNPLVMSMAFQRRRKIQSSLDQSSSKEIKDIPENPPQEAQSTVIHTKECGDAATQTEPVVDADSARPMSTTLHDNNAASPDADVRRSMPVLAIASPLTSPQQNNSDSNLSTVDPPVEAWCSSRQHSTLSTVPSPLQDSHSLLNEKLEPETSDADDLEPSTLDSPIRSYSELSFDTVVRAHVAAQAREAHAIRAMAIASHGGELVIGTNARALRVFDLTEPLAAVSPSSPLPHAAFLPLLPVTMEKHKHHSSPIYVATYNHPSSTLIATGAAESSIKVLSRWTHQQQQQQEHGEETELWIRGHRGKCRALQFVSPLLLCSAASGDLVIRCWDVGSSSPLCVQRFDGHVGEIQALAMAATALDTRSFASGAMDRTVRLWDLRSAQCARVLARTPTPTFALAFAPTSDANRLASAHQDGSVALWDLRMAREARPLATVAHHQDECRAVSWSPDGRWLLSASFDGTLCIMDSSGEPVASFHQHEDKVLQAQWHPTQPAIVTTGADKLVNLWRFT